MLRCKQVSDALAKGKYYDLPLRERIGLKTHVFLCVFCGRFNRFIMGMQDMTRSYLKHEQEDAPTADLCLTHEAKSRICETVQRAKTSDS
jgi:RNase P subunit RPR2